MINFLRPLLMLILSLFAVQIAVSQTPYGPSKTSSNPKADGSEASVLAAIPDAKGKSEKSGHPDEVNGPIDKNEPVIVDPLVRVLVTKGILTAVEGHSISGSGNVVEQRDRLASLLRDKGLLLAVEYEALRTITPAEALARMPSDSSGSFRLEPRHNRRWQAIHNRPLPR